MTHTRKGKGVLKFVMFVDSVVLTKDLLLNFADGVVVVWVVAQNWSFFVDVING